MGYDITLHPISKEEINYFVIEPFSDRSLIDKRIVELSKDDDHINFLKETYEFSFKTSPSSQHNDCLELSCLAAKIASYLHPYWYSRNICLSFLIDDKLCKPVFQPLSYCATDAQLVKKFRHKMLQIQCNQMSSGYAKAEDVANLADNLIPSIRQQAKELEDKKIGFQKSKRTLSSYVKIVFGNHKEVETPFDQSFDKISDLLVDEETLWGIQKALTYCKEHKLGLIEASDLVIPITDDFSCNPDNFNAHFETKTDKEKDLQSAGTD